MHIESRKRAILVLALGAEHRAYLSITFANLAAYAERVGAELVLITDEALLDDAMRARIATVTGSRVTPTAYVLKCIALGDTLRRYERVLLLDSTCIVTSHCDDLFAVVRESHVGAFDEGTMADFGSWKIDRRLAAEKRNVTLTTYINTGVVLASRAHLPLLTSDQIGANIDLFGSPYPSQLYVNTMLALTKTPVQALQRGYNYTPVFDYKDDAQRGRSELTTEELAVIRRDASIIHCTGYYRQRAAILEQLMREFGEPSQAQSLRRQRAQEMATMREALPSRMGNWPSEE
jgi:hypothetical protein